MLRQDCQDLIQDRLLVEFSDQVRTHLFADPPERLDLGGRRPSRSSTPFSVMTWTLFRLSSAVDFIRRPKESAQRPRMTGLCCSGILSQDSLVTMTAPRLFVTGRSVTY